MVHPRIGDDPLPAARPQLVGELDEIFGTRSLAVGTRKSRASVSHIQIRDPPWGEIRPMQSRLEGLPGYAPVDLHTGSQDRGPRPPPPSHGPGPAETA